jgi:acetyl esterase/lipase
MAVRIVASGWILVWFLSLAGHTAQSQTPASSNPRLMTPADLGKLPIKPADKRIAYGSLPEQFGELRIPAGAGPHPLVILVHGGCFKLGSAQYMGMIGDALKDEGIATWNVEYRQVTRGGGWPTTYLDVAKGIDYVRAIAGENKLDLNHAVLVGHSAGGHLALWSAARSRVPAKSEIHTSNPLKVRGVVNLAGPVDMTANIKGYETLCRDSVITTLMGGTPATVPQRYADASPIRLVPLGVPQVIVMGTYEDFVPRPIAETYVSAATKAGDSARLIVIPGMGHFEITTTHEPSWSVVRAAIRSLLDGKLPAAR